MVADCVAALLLAFEKVSDSLLRILVAVRVCLEAVALPLHLQLTIYLVHHFSVDGGRSQGLR